MIVKNPTSGMTVVLICLQLLALKNSANKCVLSDPVAAELLYVIFTGTCLLLVFCLISDQNFLGLLRMLLVILCMYSWVLFYLFSPD